MTNPTLIKLASRLPKASSLDGHAEELYGALGKHYIAIVEFRVADRTEVDPDSDAHPKVKLEIGALEVAYDPKDDELVRQMMRDIYQRRTADGTFDSVEPSGEVVRTPSDTSKPIPIKRTRAPRKP